MCPLSRRISLVLLCYVKMGTKLFLSKINVLCQNMVLPTRSSKLSPRVPAQMGRRKTEHEGGKGTGKGETRGLRVALCPGRVRLQ
jgi:hypothetical protein